MNKKIVILVVLVECILSVFFISFIGKNIENNVKESLSTSIVFTDSLGNEIKDSSINVMFTGTNNSYQLYWKINPTDVTNKSVQFESSSNDIALVDNTGRVTFIENQIVTISVRTLDGGNAIASIILIPEKDISGNVDI